MLSGRELQQQSSQQEESNLQEESSYDQRQSSEVPIPKEQLIEEEIKRIKQELKTVPYQLILKQRNALKQVTLPSTTSLKTPKLPKNKKRQPKTKPIQKEKKEKNEAVQINIHKHNRHKFKPLFESSKGKSIDPRFQNFAGHYNQDLAMKSYNFIPQLQKQEISQLKSKLKSTKKRNKISQRQREVMLREYNNVTNAFKRAQLVNVEKKTKKQLKLKYGSEFHMNNSTFKQEFQQKKFQGLSQKNKEKKIKEKQIQIRRQQLGQRRTTMHMKIK